MPILSSGYLFWDGFKYITTNTLSVGIGGDVTGTTTATTVVALQHNPVQPGTLSSSQDGYVLTWRNSANLWEPLPVPTQTFNGMPNFSTQATAVGPTTVTAKASQVVQSDPSGGQVTVNLPAAAANPNVVIVVKNVTNASGGHTVLTPAGADTIEGVSTYTLTDNIAVKKSAIIVSDGISNWNVIAVLSSNPG